MSKNKFKNSPIHDKQAIIDMMDELEPKDMIAVVELIKSKQQKPDTQKTAVEQFLNAIKDQILLSEEHIEMIESYADQCKEIEKKRIIKAWKAGDGKYDKVADKLAEQYYNENYGGGDK